MSRSDRGGLPRVALADRDTLPISPPEGEMPQAEGESVALSRRRYGPPPQSLRDSSPSGGAMESQIALTTRCGQRGPARYPSDP